MSDFVLMLHISRMKIQVAIDIASAVSFLHSFHPPVLHRDLKLSVHPLVFAFFFSESKKMQKIELTIFWCREMVESS